MSRTLVVMSVLALGMTPLTSFAERPDAAKRAQAAQDQHPQSASEAALSPAERRFIEDACRGNEDQVRLGDLAKNNAQGDDVKLYAARVVEDHAKANEALRALAQQKGVTIAPRPLPVESDLETRLARLTGERFDREYIAQIGDEHRRDLAEFQRMARDAKDADVKLFAAKMVPILEEHHRMALELKRARQSSPLPREGAQPMPQHGGSMPEGAGSRGHDGGVHGGDAGHP